MARPLQMAAGMSVTDHMQADHERLDAILEEVRELVATASFADAATRYTAFAAGLRRHIEVEEQILFPLFEKLTGMTRGPTHVMRLEHGDIQRLLDAAHAALEVGNLAGANDTLGALVEMLGAHNQKEERVLYPMIDRAVGAGPQRDDLMRRLEAF